MPSIFAEDAALSPTMHSLSGGLWKEWLATDCAVKTRTRDPKCLARENAACSRLMTVPGVGPLVATAMIAAVADRSALSRGVAIAVRTDGATMATFVAWLGLVPRQMSTGGKTLLVGITKRGNTYYRCLFIQGARSFCLNGDRSHQRIGTSLDNLNARTDKNVATVALANKLARIAWSVLAGGQEYYRIPATS